MILQHKKYEDNYSKEHYKEHKASYQKEYLKKQNSLTEKGTLCGKEQRLGENRFLLRNNASGKTAEKQTKGTKRKKSLRQDSIIRLISIQQSLENF